MSAPWLTKFALIAALVFAQAVYAGHGGQHDSEQQADCQVCMQASSGMAGLPSQCAVHTLAASATALVPGLLEPVQFSPLSYSHPSRAPPALSL